MIDAVWAGCVVFTLAIPASAHHGPVGSPSLYDVEDLVVLEGELTEVFWRSPHVRFRLKALNDAGEETFWELETGVPSQLESGGITADLFPVGGHVKAAGFVSLHNPRSLGLRNMLLPNGQEFAGTRSKLLWSTERVKRAQRQLESAKVRVAEETADRIFRVWGATMRPSEWAAAHSYDHLLTAKARRSKENHDPVSHPILDCKPRGMPERMFAGSIEFIENNKETITMRSVWWGGDRIIHLAAKEPPAGTPSTHIGYSTGHWDDGALIVKTTHVDWPYFDRAGTPQSDKVEFVERFTMTADENRLNYTLTASDPIMFTSPIVVTNVFDWRPGSEFEAGDCVLWDDATQ